MSRRAMKKGYEKGLRKRAAKKGCEKGMRQGGLQQIAGTNRCRRLLVLRGAAKWVSELYRH